MSYYAWYNDEYVYDLGEHSVSITVTLFRDKQPPIDIQALLDTGASVSIFDKAFARSLGISDISSGREIDVQTASDDEPATKGYIHDNIVIEVLSRTLAIPVAFVPDWPDGTPNLLGMEGFFDRWSFGFQHAANRLYYSEI